MPKLTDLDARLLKIEPDGFYLCAGISLPEAQGIMFLCPKCFVANQGKVGTHSVICWFKGRGVPEELTPLGRWQPSGSGIEDLSLDKSVLLGGASCAWHGFLKEGTAE